MELSKCLGCMEDLQGYPCPHCGYDPVKEKRPEYALPQETILAGKYLVGRVLGQGGFGITYIGWDLALERKVAIKEYYPSGQVSRSPGTRSLTWYTNEPAVQAREDGMKMFLKEARKMVKADSIPGVVRVLDLFQENGTAYIVMDFVSGETLKTRLQKTGPMAWTQAAPIFRPAIRAMEQVHQAGLIHRDLSPDNLMLTPNGDVKILDLGAAKDLNLNSGASSMQVAKSGFSPLEQYTQRGGSGPWTDVYSMAATIYYTLTGKLPPNAIDRMEEDAIDWSDPGMDSLPKAALKALQAAMSVSVKKRTQSMEELEEGLFAEKKTKQAERPKREQKAFGKRWVVPLAILLCLLVIGGAIAGIPKSSKASKSGVSSDLNTDPLMLETTQKNGETGIQETATNSNTSVKEEGSTSDAASANSTDSNVVYYESDTDSFRGVFHSKDGNYTLTTEGLSVCYLKSKEDKATYKGIFAWDGENLQVYFLDDAFEATGRMNQNVLSLSCKLFTSMMFDKRNQYDWYESAYVMDDLNVRLPESAHFTSVDNQYSFILDAHGFCYWTSKDSLKQYTGVYSNDGTNLKLYFADGPGEVTVLKNSVNLYLSCKLFQFRPFEKN